MVALALLVTALAATATAATAVPQTGNVALTERQDTALAACAIECIKLVGLEQNKETWCKAETTAALDACVGCVKGTNNQTLINDATKAQQMVKDACKKSSATTMVSVGTGAVAVAAIAFSFVL